MEILLANSYTNAMGVNVVVMILADDKKMLKKGGSLLHLLVIGWYLPHAIVMKS